MSAHECACSQEAARRSSADCATCVLQLSAIACSPVPISSCNSARTAGGSDADGPGLKALLRTVFSMLAASTVKLALLNRIVGPLAPAEGVESWLPMEDRRR